MMRRTLRRVVLACGLWLGASLPAVAAVTLVTSSELQVQDAAATTTTRTLAATLGTRTNGLIIGTVAVQASTSISAISATWNGNAMTLDPACYNPTAAIWLCKFYYAVGSGDASSRNWVVTYTGLNTATPITALMTLSVYDGVLQASPKDTSATATGTTNPTVSVTPGGDNYFIESTYVSASNNLLVSTNGTILQDFDAGANTLGGDYKIQTAGSGVPQAMAWSNNGTDTWYLLAVTYKLAATGSSPTIALNAPADAATTADTTPTLEFTGTDADGDDLRYQVQIGYDTSFPASGTSIQANQTVQFSASIHPNPIIGTPGAFDLTWEGNPQNDDRFCQAFPASGGVLDHFDYSIGNDPNTGGPIGSARVRLYSVYGVKTSALAVTSVTRSGTTATVTTTAPHGLLADQSVKIDGATDGANPCDHDALDYNQNIRVTVTGASTFTYPVNVRACTPATGTITATGGYMPLNAALPANTPTPGWLAQSDDVAFTTGMATGQAFYSFNFTTTNRVRLVASTIYMACMDWVPTGPYYNINNTFSVGGDSLLVAGGGHPLSYPAGNAYIDGSANNGTRTDFVGTFRVFETYTLLDKLSGTDAGFLNQVSGGDTDPFTNNQQIGFTLQAGDTLSLGAYAWRVRGKDPTGTDAFGSWSAGRTLTIGVASGPTIPVLIDIYRQRRLDQQ